MTDCRNKGGTRHAQHGSGDATLRGVETATCDPTILIEGPVCGGCWAFTQEHDARPALTCPICHERTQRGAHHLRHTVAPLETSESRGKGLW